MVLGCGYVKMWTRSSTTGSSTPRSNEAVEIVFLPVGEVTRGIMQGHARLWRLAT